MVDRTASLNEAIERCFGPDRQIMSRRSVSGGDINSASILTLDDGTRIFTKENRAELAAMFKAETEGLAAMADVAHGHSAPPVPRALAWGVDGSKAFLLLEEVTVGKRVDGEAFGRSLALLHREGRNDTCGFLGDNWIGSTPQPNPAVDSWHDFFAEHRLLFQWSLARSKGYGDKATGRQLESLCRRLPEILPALESGRPSLLHGDLWGGNWMAGEDGRAWLIDPACYFGHREADIAMTELFGGFPSGFQSGYQNEWPLEPGFGQRRDLYNLYHLLNHLNLFGSSYWGGVRRTISSYA